MRWVRCTSKRIGFTVGKLYPVNEDVLDVDGQPTTTDDDGSRRPLYLITGELFRSFVRSFVRSFEEVTKDDES